ncbi:uncharacterized protein LOC125647663 [Ostrea edulis]|uniref:uncharacterized protein LOC125647663 n=1 Tax=Ostrea edulis TaxID=37623 RepID=UPI0024AE96FE|nr:uncharacterized protein LOC125647663 [Ostrea edulis]XP_048730395.2 uncharacterized protein LOC125647663 [Ostrea edulis]
MNVSTITSPSETAEDLSLDKVLIFVLVFVSMLVLIFVISGVYKIKEFCRERNTDTGISEDIFEHPHRDAPPPYPGKLSRTDVNYLPSYDSAVQMSTILDITSGSTNRPEELRTDQYITDGQITTVPPTDMPPTTQSTLETQTTCQESVTQTQSITEENIVGYQSPTVFTL